MKENNINKLNNIFYYIKERASLMKSVAEYKFINNKNLYLPERELLVLLNIKNIAKIHNLNYDSILVFSQIQMDLSKLIEYFWIKKWKKDNEKVSHNYETLNNIRQKINDLDHKLYLCLKKYKNILQTIDFNKSYILFKDIMKTIEGIPTEPDYLRLMLYSLLSIY